MPEIPEIETVFLRLVDKKPISTKYLIETLKLHFDLSKEDLNCLTACGRQKKFDNRVIYVRTKLIREGKIKMDTSRNIWKST